MDAEKTKISKISNIIFTISTAFILSFIWINFYIRKLSLSLISALIFTSCFAVVLLLFLHRKNKVNSFNKSIEQKKKMIKNYLMFEKDLETTNLISALFDTKNTNPTNETFHKICDEEKLDIYYLFGKEKINNDDLISTIKSRKYNKILLFCIANETNIELNNVDIKIIDFEIIFEKLHQTKELYAKIIDKEFIKKPAKLSLYSIFCVILNKSKSKSYFWFGTILIISSLFTLYSTYYIIVGTILILISLYARFNTYFNKTA